MIQSPELDQLFVALTTFQSKVGAIPKNAVNPFFKSKYAALADVVATASPILAECGLCVTQHLGHDEPGDNLTTILGHKTGQYLGSTMRLRPVKNDPQSQGSAASYGRRYAYMAILGLVADEDDDGNAASAPRTTKARSNGRAADKPVTKPVAKVDADTVTSLIDGVATIGLLDKLQLAASHVAGGDVGDCSTPEKAAVALGSLTTAQAAKLTTWINRKADEQLTADV